MRMNFSVVLLLVVALAGPAFAIPTYIGGTLDYPCGDLAFVVDPLGNAADVLPGQQCGIPLPAYNAMPPQVVHFNTVPQGQGNPGPLATIVAHYSAGDPSKTVTIDHFVNLALGFGGNYPYGLVPTSLNAANDPVGGMCDDVFNNPGGAGARPWPAPEPQGYNEGVRWFGCDIACSAPNEYVSSFAFTACGQPPGNWSCSAGNAYFLLSDGSYGIVPYVAFGGNLPQHASIAYQAPPELGIVAVDCIAIPQNHVNYLDLDDFGFTIGQLPSENPVSEPGALLLVGGLFGLLRRKRS